MRKQCNHILGCGCFPLPKVDESNSWAMWARRPGTNTMLKFVNGLGPYESYEREEWRLAGPGHWVKV